MSKATSFLGSFPAIFIVLTLIIAWFIGGLILGFTDSWQIAVNTPTTIVTAIMAFVIQNTQNRDGRAIQTKLDAILHALDAAPDDIMGLEDHPEKAIKNRQREVRDSASDASSGIIEPCP